MPPFPILRYLTPLETVTPPDDFILVNEPIMTGLPYAIELGGNLSLLLVMPIGTGVLWRDALPGAVVSQSSVDLQTFNPAQPPASSRPPLRLLVRHNGSTVGAIPLIANSIRTVETSIGIRTFDLLILGWDIRAGNLRGAGDFGSRITLAWQWADEAVEQFSTPPVSPAVEIRQPPERRKLSESGKLRYELRFVNKFVYRDISGMISLIRNKK